MKNRTLSLLVILMSLFPLSLWAQGGNEVGNGADFPKEGATHAWFVQKVEPARPLRPIRYCYNIAPGFGVDESTVRKETSSAFQTWTEYLEFKEVNRGQPVRVTTEGLELLACDGTEDLRFELGTHTEEIEKDKQEFHNPTAFVSQENYSQEEGWGKGYIWLASMGSVDPQKNFPNWQEDGSLQALLLHELGHVFGSGHIQGTILDARLAILLRDHLWPNVQKRLIDYSREVKSERQADRCYEGQIGNPLEPGSLTRVFITTIGAPPNGKVTAKLRISAFRTQLDIWDGDRLYQFPLIGTGVMSMPQIEGAYSFHYSLLDQGQLLKRETWVTGQVTSATMFVGYSEEISALIEENISSPLSQAYGPYLAGPLNIKYSYTRVNGEKEVGTLFTSAPLGIGGSRCQ